jgi:DNA polymerase V
MYVKLPKPPYYVFRKSINLELAIINQALLSGHVDKQYRQQDLLKQPSDIALNEAEKLMSIIESVNRKYGARTVHMAAEGLIKPWSMKRQLKSPNYTTQWHELPIVYAR